MSNNIIRHDVDFCVIGGGLAGLAAAVSAARRGVKTLLMQERPMLGGNASSEIRMWVCGAHGKNMRETGLLEELRLENQYRNPNKNYSIWDGIMYEMARFTPNLTLLLNCSCNDLGMRVGDGNSDAAACGDGFRGRDAIGSGDGEASGDGIGFGDVGRDAGDNGIIRRRIEWVRGWQMTTQQVHEVSARIFADCSGDSVLAPLSGAAYRVGREAKDEFDEDIGVDVADRKTMGMSCLIQAREEDVPSEFIPPSWAYKYSKGDLPHRVPDMRSPAENFWYIELGGDRDSIADTESVRDELLKVAYGVWDYVKNAPENREANRFWRLDWMGILPGKRESRRYEGDYMLRQGDLRSGGHFDDIVAYGGWSMDNHHPSGFNTPAPPTIFHPSPSPYGIPYRCLYSRNVDNLMFAGRNISMTHVASSSARVMATCMMLGQAAGTAAAVAIQRGLTPRGVYAQAINELKQALMEDDCYLPYNRRDVPDITRKARLICNAPDAENLRNGYDRPIVDDDNGCSVTKGGAIEYRFDKPVRLSRARIIFDSDLDDETLNGEEAQLRRNMLANRSRNWKDSYVPKTIVKSYRLEILDAAGNAAASISVDDNHQRRRVHVLTAETGAEVEASVVRLTPLETWGSDMCHIFSFDVC